MKSVRGLYVITDAELLAERGLVAGVTAALAGGAAVVQYRDKGQDAARRRREAEALAECCRAHGALFLVNDDVALARAVGADGVHVGREDTAVVEARDALGPDAVVGVSCYNSVPRALQAEADGASYVAFGRFFPSRTKPHAVPADPDLLPEARRRLTVPVVAIGGITPDNGGELVAAGADALAVIHGVFGQPDPAAAARAYVRLFA